MLAHSSMWVSSGLRYLKAVNTVTALGMEPTVTGTIHTQVNTVVIHQHQHQPLHCFNAIHIDQIAGL